VTHSPRTPLLARGEGLGVGFSYGPGAGFPYAPGARFTLWAGRAVLYFPLAVFHEARSLTRFHHAPTFACGLKTSLPGVPITYSTYGM